MRLLFCVFVLPVVVGVFVFSAQGQNPTDAQRDELAGPVKSVLTSTNYSHIQWGKPDGPSLVTPVWCRDCEYSPDGFRTKEG